MVCAILPLFALHGPGGVRVNFPPGAALFHLAFGIATSILLMEIMFLGFRKVPFTCAHFPGKVNLVFLAVHLCLRLQHLQQHHGRLEQWLAATPIAGPSLSWLLRRAVYFVARPLRVARFWDASRLDYEDDADPTVRTLGLTHPITRRHAMLEIQDLTKYYRNIPVVDDVSFAVRPGEVTGYLGPNGSGKSTTVKIVTALIEPSRRQGAARRPGHPPAI